MAGIVHIAAGADPPAGIDWVLITRETPKAFPGSGSVKHSSGKMFYGSPARDLSVIIDSACAWADAHGVSMVYFRSLPNVPRH